MRYLIVPAVAATIWALRRLYQRTPIDWDGFQRATRHLGRSTGGDIGELMVAANSATYRPGMEGHALTEISKDEADSRRGAYTSVLYPRSSIRRVPGNSG